MIVSQIAETTYHSLILILQCVTVSIFEIFNTKMLNETFIRTVLVSGIFNHRGDFLSFGDAPI